MTALQRHRTAEVSRLVNNLTRIGMGAAMQNKQIIQQTAYGMANRGNWGDVATGIFGNLISAAAAQSVLRRGLSQRLEYPYPNAAGEMKRCRGENIQTQLAAIPKNQTKQDFPITNNSYENYSLSSRNTVKIQMSRASRGESSRRGRNIQTQTPRASRGENDRRGRVIHTQLARASRSENNRRGRNIHTRTPRASRWEASKNRHSIKC